MSDPAADFAKKYGVKVIKPQKSEEPRASAEEFAKKYGVGTTTISGADAISGNYPDTPEARAKAAQEAMAALNGYPSAQAAKDAAPGLYGAITRGVTEGLLSLITPSSKDNPFRGIEAGDEWRKRGGEFKPEYLDPTITDAVASELTKLGVAEPKDASQRILKSIITGATAAGTGVGLGRAIPAEMGTFFKSQPSQQVAAGAGAMGASQTAAEAGATDPISQGAAGLLGAVTSAGIAGAKPSVETGMKPLPTTDLKTLLRRSGNKSVQEQLAQRLDVDPEGIAASQRLGMNLPADVFARNTQMKELAGVTRGVRGSAASEDWANVLADSLDRADETLKNIGVVYENGKPSLPVVSANVLHDLAKARDANITAAKEVFKRVDEVVPKATPVELPNTAKALQDIKAEVGDQIYPQEQALLDSIAKGNLTYGGFIRIKNSIGEALGGQGPYADLKGASAARLYDALKEDQKFNVGKLGSPDLVTELDAANAAYRKGSELRDLVIRGFGENETGGIGSKLVAALDPSSLKKDASQFNKAMEFVPDDLKGQAIATAIASKSRATSGDKSVFSPNSYADVYEGILSNKDVAKQVFSSLPEGSYQFMSDLYSVSKAIRNAQNAISRTGASMQAFKDTLGADSLIDSVMNAATRAGAGAVGGAIGTTVAGPGIGTAAGIAGGYALGDSLIKGRPAALAKAGKLLRSEKFQKMAIDAATKKTSPNVANVANSEEFKAFADSIGVPKDQRYSWLVGALVGSNPQTSIEINRNKPQPMSALEANRAKGRS